jgi:hypothetical protein
LGQSICLVTEYKTLVNQKIMELTQENIDKSLEEIFNTNNDRISAIVSGALIDLFLKELI